MDGTVSKISKEDLASLQHLSDILHLFYHRNKNQHRRSVWWRHFSLFRKHVNKLVVAVNELQAVPATHLARTKKKAQDTQTTLQLDQTVVCWRDGMVPKWQHAFSQVTADGRFAVLGLVLIASLAEVCRLVGFTATFEELGQAEMEKVLERFAEEGWEGQDDVLDARTKPVLLEDEGEVVMRGLSEPEAQSGSPVGRAEASKVHTATAKAALAAKPRQAKRSRVSEEPLIKKRKKRKNGDAIDDLFSGLG